MSYTYNKAGKYLITLTVEDKFEIPKYIEIVEVKRNTARDSIPTIHGVNQAHVDEELVFFTNTPGIDAWYWEFGETGMVDAYESQVIYAYKEPGTYLVKLRTDQSRYPVYHLSLIHI